jgi:hypothetical protein
VRAICGLVILAPLLAACGATGPEDARLAALEAHLARWHRVGPTSYVYAIERMCFCPAEYLGPVRVWVENREVVELAYVDTGLGVAPDLAAEFPTVEGLFEVLRSAIERRADRIDVTYDAVLGLPLDFWIDYSEMAVDEELGMRVTEAVGPLP